jgi:ATP-dependent helicase Lhr and Lhr-like helicase
VRPDASLNGSTAIHGIWADQLTTAPSFAQVGGAVAARLVGAVIIGHNVAFDLAFLTASFARAGAPMPPWPAICTMHLTQRLGLDPPGGWSLAACCEAVGVEFDPEQAHSALADARATAELFADYLELACTLNGTGDTLAALGCEPLITPPTRWRTGLGYRSRQHRRDHSL